MSAGGQFTQFGGMPSEIRLYVWEQHFQNPHIHTIKHFQGSVHDPSHPMLLLCENTTVVPTEASIANAESSEVARLVEKRRIYVALGKDVTQRAVENQGAERQAAQSRRYREFEGAVFPASVNWDTDLIYLDLPGVFDPFSLAHDQRWTGRIQCLALRLSKTSIKHLGYQLHTARSDRQVIMQNAEETLAPFAALAELVFAIDPFPGSEDDWRRKPRDAYGFIPFDVHRDCDKGPPGPPVAFQQLVEVY